MNSECRKVKVMHILNTGSYSGAENVVITLINALKQEADCVYVSPEGSIRKVLENNNISFYPVSKLSVSNLKSAIRSVNPDIIHAHDFTAGVMASASTHRIPIISHLHNNPPWIKRHSIKTITYAISAIKVKKILTVSCSVMDEFVFGKFFQHKTKVVGNPINIQAIRDKAEEAELREPYDVVFLGRITEQKNPLFFVEVIGTLRNRIPDLKVAMVGEGEMREEVEQRIKQLSLQNNIVMYGFVENPYGILKNAKVMCMPSRWEGYGLAAVEALALGVPVVASPVGGLVDIIDRQCGSLCKSKEEFIDKLQEIILSAELRTEKSARAKEKAGQLNNMEAYAKNMMNVYREINSYSFG